MNQRLDRILLSTDHLVGGWRGSVNNEDRQIHTLELWRNAEGDADIIVIVQYTGAKRVPVRADVLVRQPLEQHLSVASPYPMYDDQFVLAEGLLLHVESGIPTLMPDGTMKLPKELPRTTDGVTFLTR